MRYTWRRCESRNTKQEKMVLLIRGLLSSTQVRNILVWFARPLIKLVSFFRCADEIKNQDCFMFHSCFDFDLYEYAVNRKCITIGPASLAELFKINLEKNKFRHRCLCRVLTLCHSKMNYSIVFYNTGRIIVQTYTLYHIFWTEKKLYQL